MRSLTFLQLSHVQTEVVMDLRTLLTRLRKVRQGLNYIECKLILRMGFFEPL